MIYIAHRGNTHGVKKNLENSPEYILDALKMGFDCEIDVWFLNGNWKLGHDTSQYHVNLDFLYTPGLWCHCKNMAAFVRLNMIDSINTFWHQEDDYVLTTHKYIWCYPGKTVDLPRKAICVKPEIHDTNWSQFDGICSDYVGYHRDQASTL